MTELPEILVRAAVERALVEDLGQGGDLTSSAVVPRAATMRADVVAREGGVMAGIQALSVAFRLLDEGLRVDVQVPDGHSVQKGTVVAGVAGRARAILAAERTALNFVSHLSGVASATARLVKAVEGTGARICCTRKTVPGLRALQKHAVRMGGGVNHRFSLDGSILIKDNHVVAAGGIAVALEAAREATGPATAIQIEVDTLGQLSEALDAGAHAVLLDNLSPADLRRAVDMTGGRAVLEASGRIAEETVRAVAETGVDYISSGWITHSAPILDFGLDVAGRGPQGGG